MRFAGAAPPLEFTDCAAAAAAAAAAASAAAASLSAVGFFNFFETSLLF